MAFVAGHRLTADLLNDTFPESAFDEQTTAGTTTSSSYSATLTGGTACGVVFTAPKSGKILVVNTGQLDSSTTQTALMGFTIRTGSTIGSGTVFKAVSDDDSQRNVGTDEHQGTHSMIVSGLTPGNTYNCQQQFRSNGGATATFIRKRLAVIPVI